MLSWIPLLGPIIQGIISIFTKWQDVKLDTLKTNRSSDIEEAKVSAQIIQTTQDDIGLRIMRDLVCFPIVVWVALVSWDTIVALHYPDWMFHVAGFDRTSAPYLPYAVITFLLGNIGINMWNRK
jgi:hypothetical protein